MKNQFIPIFLANFLVLTACSTHSRVTPSEAVVPEPVRLETGARQAALPMAVIYKIPEQYSNLVPVTINAAGEPISYPAPTDLTSQTAPVALCDGWFLDRQGVGPSTSFVRWTRQEYASLGHAPTPGQIKDAVVPAARFTAMYRLPMTASEAAADTAAVNALIRQGLPGCESLLKVFTRP